MWLFGWVLCSFESKFDSKFDSKCEIELSWECLLLYCTWRLLICYMLTNWMVRNLICVATTKPCVCSVGSVFFQGLQGPSQWGPQGNVIQSLSSCTSHLVKENIHTFKTKHLKFKSKGRAFIFDSGLAHAIIRWSNNCKICLGWNEYQIKACEPYSTTLLQYYCATALKHKNSKVL